MDEQYDCFDPNSHKRELQYAKYYVQWKSFGKKI